MCCSVFALQMRSLKYVKDADQCLRCWCLIGAVSLSLCAGTLPEPLLNGNMDDKVSVKTLIINDTDVCQTSTNVYIT